MDQRIIDVITECTRASDEQRITFPEVVGRLMQAGVERYHADLCRSEKTYYLPSGESQAVPCHAMQDKPAVQFSAAQVESAIRASQAGTIKYQEFCRLVLAAGCVGYIVTLVGRRAVYFGRTGEMHVEHFPS